ncbi:unnamed protein product [Mytilus coruscus]|uniref:Uncharacterized protein n=1 Tax=Mytilus coruscus TaxID=42192 RepID=A0A6J7ZV36_MYTCO|nr:unnamed protein product [Mytilus coruscus]
MKRQKEKLKLREDDGLHNTQITTVDQNIDRQMRTLTSSDDILHDETALNVGEFKPELFPEVKTNYRRKKAKSSPNTIFTCSWQKDCLVSIKAPTSVLLDKEKNFVAFGSEAETKYLYSLEKDESDSDSDSDDKDRVPKDVYHYFNRFTMMLHEKTVNFDTTIKDQNGIQMKAFDIYSFSIKYMKDQVIRKLVNSPRSVETKDILYVLIVPAKWNDQAKTFMRKAAEKAGINGEDLKIAVEPEAALIDCQELLTDSYQYNKKAYSGTMKGSKYVVVDLGATDQGCGVINSVAPSTAPSTQVLNKSSVQVSPAPPKLELFYSTTDLTPKTTTESFWLSRLTEKEFKLYSKESYDKKSYVAQQTENCAPRSNY